MRDNTDSSDSQVPGLCAQVDGGEDGGIKQSGVLQSGGLQSESMSSVRDLGGTPGCNA